MGCDIHISVEVSDSEGGYEHLLVNYSTDRDYRLFAALAGVRNRENTPVLYPPRGLPADISYAVIQEAADPVLELNPTDRNPRNPYDYFEAFDDFVTPAQAEALRSKWSELYGEDNPPPDYFQTAEWGTFLLKDHHSHSFLTREQALQAISHNGLTAKDAPSDFHFILDLMALAERHFSGQTIRMVFWFSE